MEKRSFLAGAFSMPVRVLAASLVAVSRGSLPVMAAGMLTAEGTVPLFALVRALVLFALVPALAARLIHRAMVAEVRLVPTELVVERRDLQVDVPCASIERVLPWWVPLPGPGLSLRLRSGRRFPYGIAADPLPLLDALADVAGVAQARAAAAHPMVVWAHARRERPARWHRPLAKFLGFGLVPGAVMFNLDQHVTFGGLFGQYYLEGIGPWLRSFAVYWGLASIYLLLYASVWRALAEAVTVLAAAVAPAHAARVRRAAEVSCSIVYYVGVPMILAIPFLR